MMLACQKEAKFLLVIAKIVVAANVAALIAAILPFALIPLAACQLHHTLAVLLSSKPESQLTVHLTESP